MNKIEDHEKTHKNAHHYRTKCGLTSHSTFNPISFLFTLLLAICVIIFLFCFVLCAFCVTNDARTCSLEKLWLVLNQQKIKFHAWTEICVSLNDCAAYQFICLTSNQTTIQSINFLYIKTAVSTSYVRILRKRKNAPSYTNWCFVVYRT